MSMYELTRRGLLGGLAGAGVATMFPSRGVLAAGAEADANAFRLRYCLASSMYGTTALAEILPEVAGTGAAHIDLWPRVHGNQREQADEMGVDALRVLLKKHQVKLGMTTRYDLGPFRLKEEVAYVHGFGGRLIVCGSKGPRNAKGAALKAAVNQFVEKMKPHVAWAGKHDVTIAIENHGHALIASPDSVKYFADAARDLPHLGLAMAPYHLPQDPALLASLIRHLDAKLVHFYAWEHGDGCMKKLPKEQEMKQMPGRGPLDFGPLIQAMKKVSFQGWTQVFMHPVPRGIPILTPTSAVTAAINESRAYLEALV